MTNVSQWNTSAGSNNAAPPAGAPEGMDRDKVNDTMREMMAAVARWYAGTDGSLVSAGGTTAYTLTTGSSHANLADIGLLVFRVNATNTGAVTLAVDGLAAKSVVSTTGAALAAGTLVINQLAVAVYNPNQDRFELLSSLPLVGLTTETAIATDDHLIFTDTSDSDATEKITVANFLKIISGLSEQTTIDADADFVALIDATDGAAYKVSPYTMNEWVAIGSVTAASAAAITFTDADLLDVTNFTTFSFEFQNVTPDTDNVQFYCRLRDDGAGAFDSGASDYSWSTFAHANSTQLSSDTADSEIQLTNNTFGVDDTIGLSGFVKMIDGPSANETRIISDLTHKDDATDIMVKCSCVGRHVSNGAIDGITFFPSSGNVTGTIVIYGLRAPR